MQHPRYSVEGVLEHLQHARQHYSPERAHEEADGLMLRLVQLLMDDYPTFDCADGDRHVCRDILKEYQQIAFPDMTKPE